MTYLLITLNIILLVAGQMLWKQGMLNYTYTGIINLIKFAFTPYIFIGLIVYGLATIIWLYLLKTAEFSLIYPLQSLAYIIGVIAACIIFKENVSIIRWTGIAIIFLGVILVAKG